MKTTMTISTKALGSAVPPRTLLGNGFDPSRYNHDPPSGAARSGTAAKADGHHEMLPPQRAQIPESVLSGGEAVSLKLRRSAMFVATTTKQPTSSVRSGM